MAKGSKIIPFSLEPHIEFKCIHQEEYSCFKKEKNGSLDICKKAPCPLISRDFGIHERILDHYQDNDNFNDPYYYLQDLLSKCKINCDVQQMEKIRQEKKGSLEAADYPPGCRIFYYSLELKDIKRAINYYAGLDSDKLSEEGKKTFENYKTQFRDIMDKAIEILKHLVLDQYQKDQEDIRDKVYNLLLTATQMGDLKPEALELPLNKHVTDAIEHKGEGDKDKENPKNERKKNKKKDEIPGI